MGLKPLMDPRTANIPDYAKELLLRIQKLERRVDSMIRKSAKSAKSANGGDGGLR